MSDLQRLADEVGKQAEKMLHDERHYAAALRARVVAAASTLALVQLEALSRGGAANEESVRVARARMDNLAAAGLLEVRISLVRTVQAVLIRGLATLAGVS